MSRGFISSSLLSQQVLAALMESSQATASTSSCAGWSAPPRLAQLPHTMMRLPWNSSPQNRPKGSVRPAQLSAGPKMLASTGVALAKARPSRAQRPLPLSTPAFWSRDFLSTGRSARATTGSTAPPENRASDMTEMVMS